MQLLQSQSDFSQHITLGGRGRFVRHGHLQDAARKQRFQVFALEKGALFVAGVGRQFGDGAWCLGKRHDLSLDGG